MNVQDYIKVYEGMVEDELCNSLMSAKLDYEPSSFANHEGITENSEEKVVMDDVWIRKNNKFYEPLKECFVKAVRQYEYDFPLFMCEHTTDFRINKYGTGGFMSEHIDNIHHSHGQKWGYPHVTILLYLNDDYDGGEFVVAGKEIKPNKGSAIVFPANFMYPHEAKIVTEGTRWSVLAWLM
jgi:predicted 2-oxoglutarate/Fe(II)-dependent dioxygenase YbiX